MATLPVCVSLSTVVPPICPATLWGHALPSPQQFGGRRDVGVEGHYLLPGLQIRLAHYSFNLSNFNLRPIGERGEGDKTR